MNALIIFSGLSLLTGMADPQTASPPANSDVIEYVRWIRRPEPEAVAQYQPGFASMIGLSGRVTLRCEASLDGRPRNCTALSIQPEGLGFDDAAKLVVATGQVRPMMVNGEPQLATFNVSINFNSLPIPAIPKDPYQGPEPSDRAVKLARQIVDLYPPETDPQWWDSTLGQLDSDRQSTVRQWLMELFPFDVDEESKRFALGLARLVSEQDLELYLSTGVPPKLLSIKALDTAVGSEDVKSLRALQTLRSRYCAQWSCEIEQD